jgi:hypothetical protein
MRKTIKGQQGLSLVEVTIMLLVLMLLTSVLAPSIWDFVHDAQWVKVKEDCEAIGISFTRLTRDIGPCLRADHLAPCVMSARVDVLGSDGAVPLVTAATATTAGNIATKNWDGTGGGPLNSDTMDSQFVQNGPAYRTTMDNYPLTYPVGPHFGLGWRGPYLSAPIGPDPWGSKYYVNSGFNAVANDAPVLSEDGYRGRWWERDVFCLSAGPDQTIETNFGLAVAGPGTYWGTSRQGDDYVFVISGSGR